MLNKQSETKCACTEEKSRTTKAYLDTPLGVATYVPVEGLERVLAVPSTHKVNHNYL